MVTQMRIYDYFFYRLYKLLRQKRDETFGVWGTAIVISMLIFINLGNLGVFLHKKNIIPKLIPSRMEIISILIILFTTNFYLFYRNKRYKVIEQRYSTESKVSNTIGTIGMISLIVFTIILYAK